MADNANPNKGTNDSMIYTGTGMGAELHEQLVKSSRNDYINYTLDNLKHDVKHAYANSGKARFIRTVPTDAQIESTCKALLTNFNLADLKQRTGIATLLNGGSLNSEDQIDQIGSIKKLIGEESAKLTKFKPGIKKGATVSLIGTLIVAVGMSLFQSGILNCPDKAQTMASEAESSKPETPPATPATSATPATTEAESENSQEEIIAQTNTEVVYVQKEIVISGGDGGGDGFTLDPNQAWKNVKPQSWGQIFDFCNLTFAERDGVYYLYIDYASKTKVKVKDNYNIAALNAGFKNYKNLSNSASTQIEEENKIVNKSSDDKKKKKSSSSKSSSSKKSGDLEFDNGQLTNPSNPDKDIEVDMS